MGREPGRWLGETGASSHPARVGVAGVVGRAAGSTAAGTGCAPCPPAPPRASGQSGCTALNQEGFSCCPDAGGEHGLGGVNGCSRSPAPLGCPHQPQSGLDLVPLSVAVLPGCTQLLALGPRALVYWVKNVLGPGAPSSPGSLEGRGLSLRRRGRVPGRFSRSQRLCGEDFGSTSPAPSRGCCHRQRGGGDVAEPRLLSSGRARHGQSPGLEGREMSSSSTHPSMPTPPGGFLRRFFPLLLTGG